MIIDVDAHGEPPAELIRAVQEEVGISQANVGESTLKFVAGDLLATAPRESWPTLEQLLPPGSRAIAGLERVEGFAYDGAKQHGIADAASRIAWMDRIGIDYQNVIALAGVTATRFMEDRDRARRIIAACNRAMADAHDGYTDRLWPTTTIEWNDLDAAIDELTYMRSRGSRSFLVSATPTNGIPHFHSAFDRVWSAAVDLGMVPILHVGMNPTVFAPGWTEVEGDMTLLRQLGVCQGHQSVQMFLNGMVFGGVFERHPGLTVLVAECGVHWFNGTVEHMQQRDSRQSVSAGLFFGEYRWSLSPEEFALRNIRVAPLPTPHQSPRAILDRYPTCAVFASDYAHNEGHPSPLDYYDELLSDCPAPVREQFFGASMADCFARMGHPLPGRVAASTRS